MSPSHQVLILSDSITTVIPPLEQALSELNGPRFKFIHPSKIYKTDFIESEFIILDHAYWVKHQTELKPAFQYPEKLSFFATLTEQSQMNQILKETHIPHFFGMSGTETFRDIAQYLIHGVKKDFWSASTFVTEPLISKSVASFSTSQNLESQIQIALATHEISETFEGFKPIIEKILNEALTNALYNAPVDGNGKPINRERDRKEIVKAESGREPVMEILQDADKIVLSVKDFYGSLTKNVIDHYLTHGEVAEKAGGAGVGMYLIMRDAHKLVINIDPGKMTELIIVLHKFKRFSHYQALEKSFHLFERKPS